MLRDATFVRCARETRRTEIRNLDWVFT